MFDSGPYCACCLLLFSKEHSNFNLFESNAAVMVQIIFMKYLYKDEISGAYFSSFIQHERLSEDT